MKPDVESILETTLSLLRTKIREKGFTQVAVQDALGWKGSYISQLFNRTKSLRVEQLLQMLAVIEVDPIAFLFEVYRRPLPEPDDDLEQPRVGLILLLNKSRRSNVKGRTVKVFQERRDLLELQGLIEKATCLACDLATVAKPFESDALVRESRRR